MDMTMDGLALRALLHRLPLADGYRYEPLRRDEVEALVEVLPAWYPDILVGAASCYLRRGFYDDKVWFDDRPDRDVYVIALRHGDALAGLFSWDLDRDAMTVYGRLGVSAPAHRGARLTQAGLALLEAFGRRVAAGMLYGLATLKTRHVQAQFERSGWRLVGITPGYDRELVAAASSACTRRSTPRCWPTRPSCCRPQQMTAATQALFEAAVRAPAAASMSTHGRPKGSYGVRSTKALDRARRRHGIANFPAEVQSVRDRPIG
jgi:hypothetical protein